MSRDYLLAKRRACPFRHRVVVRMQGIEQIFDSVQKQQDIYNWLLNTLPSDAYSLEKAVIRFSNDRKYYFKNADDASLFKLTWGN